MTIRNTVQDVNYRDRKGRGFRLRRRNFHRPEGRQSGSRLHGRSPSLGRFGPSPAYRAGWALRSASNRTPGVCATPVLTPDRAAQPISSERTGGWIITLTRFTLGVKSREIRDFPYPANLRFARPRGTLAVFSVGSVGVIRRTPIAPFLGRRLYTRTRIGYHEGRVFPVNTISPGRSASNRVT